MSLQLKAEMMKLLDDEEYVSKLKTVLFDGNGRAAAEIPGNLKEVVKDIFEVHFIEHIDLNLRWDELHKDLIKEMVEKVTIVTAEEGNEVSRTIILRKLREAYNGKRKTFKNNSTKEKRRSSRKKNRKSYLTYNKRNLSLRAAINEGHLNPEDKEACENYRKNISPHKGAIQEEHSSDEELMQEKKDKRKEILNKARKKKQRYDQLKKKFTLQNQMGFQQFCEANSQRDIDTNFMENSEFEENEELDAYDNNKREGGDDDETEDNFCPPTPKKGSYRRSIFSQQRN